MAILRKSCYAFIINGFWAYFNLQIFTKGAYHFKDTSDAFMKSGHLVTFNVSWILFFIFSLIITFIMRGVLSAEEPNVDEDLPNFFECITLTSADMIV